MLNHWFSDCAFNSFNFVPLTFAGENNKTGIPLISEIDNFISDFNARVKQFSEKITTNSHPMLGFGIFDDVYIKGRYNSYVRLTVGFVNNIKLNSRLSKDSKIDSLFRLARIVGVKPNSLIVLILASTLSGISPNPSEKMLKAGSCYTSSKAHNFVWDVISMEYVIRMGYSTKDLDIQFMTSDFNMAVVWCSIGFKYVGSVGKTFNFDIENLDRSLFTDELIFKAQKNKEEHDLYADFDDMFGVLAGIDIGTGIFG